MPCSGDGTLRKRHANTPPWTPSVAVELHDGDDSVPEALRELLRDSTAAGAGASDAAAVVDGVIQLGA